MNRLDLARCWARCDQAIRSSPCHRHHGVVKGYTRNPGASVWAELLGRRSPAARPGRTSRPGLPGVLLCRTDPLGVPTQGLALKGRLAGRVATGRLSLVPRRRGRWGGGGRIGGRAARLVRGWAGLTGAARQWRAAIRRPSGISRIVWVGLQSFWNNTRSNALMHELLLAAAESVGGDIPTLIGGSAVSRTVNESVPLEQLRRAVTGGRRRLPRSRRRHGAGGSGAVRTSRKPSLFPRRLLG